MNGQRSWWSRPRGSNWGNGRITGVINLREAKRSNCGQKQWREISAEGLRSWGGRFGIWQLRHHGGLEEEQFWGRVWNRDCLRRILRPAFLPTGYTSHSPSDSQGAQTHNVGAVCLWGPNWLMSVLGPSSLIKNMKIKHLLQRRKGVLRQLGEKNCLLRRIKQNRK